MHVYCAVGITHQTGSLTAIDCEWASVGQLTIVQIGQEIISPTLLDILVCFLFKQIVHHSVAFQLGFQYLPTRVHTGKFEQNSRTSQDYPTVFKD